MAGPSKYEACEAARAVEVKMVDTDEDFSFIPPKIREDSLKEDPPEPRPVKWRRFDAELMIREVMPGFYLLNNENDNHAPIPLDRPAKTYTFKRVGDTYKVVER